MARFLAILASAEAWQGFEAGGGYLSHAADGWRI